MPDRILTNQAGSLHGMRITAQPAGGLNRQKIFPLFSPPVSCRRRRSRASHAVLTRQNRGSASKDHEPCRAASAGFGLGHHVPRGGQLYLYRQ